MKKIVSFVEGEGDADAVPILLRKIVAGQNACDSVTIDPSPFRVGQVNKLRKNGFSEWRNKIRAALKKPDVGGILLLLDGDVDLPRKEPFCAMSVAREFAREARSVGAGAKFSVACVFACLEFESWLIAAAAGMVKLPAGRVLTLPPQLPADPETAPRSAKAWLNGVLSGGYRATLDRSVLTQAIDLDVLRSANLRSFRRCEDAVAELVAAIRTGKQIASPVTGD